MYFILKGEVEVTAGADGDQLGFLGKGAFFGEKTVIESVGRCFGVGNATRNRTIRATQDVELGILRTEMVLRLCDLYPEASPHDI